MVGVKRHKRNLDLVSKLLFGTLRRLRASSASSSSSGVFGVFGRLRRLRASSASSGVFGRLRRLRASSASSGVFGVFGVFGRLRASSGVFGRLRRLRASSASSGVFGVFGRLRRLRASSGIFGVFGVFGRLRASPASSGVFGRLRRLRRLQRRLRPEVGAPLLPSMLHGILPYIYPKIAQFLLVNTPSTEPVRCETLHLTWCQSSGRKTCQCVSAGSWVMAALDMLQPTSSDTLQLFEAWNCQGCRRHIQAISLYL